MLTAEQIFQAIQLLPIPERLRLVERVIHELAEAAALEASSPPPATAASGLVGLLTDSPISSLK
jgi:hypothetical protein